MASLVLSGLVLYALLVGGMSFGVWLDGVIGSLLFWTSFAISSFMLFRLYGFIRDFFIDIAGRCHEIDQSYIDEEMRKYEESKAQQED
jgi:hypothetical protein